jgi:hypothetical protein
MFHELLGAAACSMKQLRPACRGRINTAGVVSRNEHGIDIICEKGAEYVFRGILYSLDTLGLIDQPEENDKMPCLTDAFDWIVDLHLESMSRNTEKGKDFRIHKAANSKMVASFLQRPRKGLPKPS